MYSVSPQLCMYDMIIKYFVSYFILLFCIYTTSGVPFHSVKYTPTLLVAQDGPVSTGFELTDTSPTEIVQSLSLIPDLIGWPFGDSAM